LEINHCSDYFLSANSNLVSVEDTEDNEEEVPNNNEGQAPGSNAGGVPSNGSENGSNTGNTNLPETGGSNPIFSLIVGISLLGIGGVLTIKRK